MLKKLTLRILALTLFSFAGLPAIIIETPNIEQITPYINQNSFVLFNIAEVLTDSTLTLGSSPWRKYIKRQTANHEQDLQNRIHDTLTLLAIKNIPHKCVEAITPNLIQSLQEQGIAVAALTGRGRHEWYNTQVAGIDDLTEELLNSFGIDFSRSQLPFVFIQSEEGPLEHYRNGIFYCNHIGMGPFLKELLQNSGYQPHSVILIDDKQSSLENVEKAMNELGIPFIGFWYRRTMLDHLDFNPMVANIQLQQLLDGQTPVSDQEATALIEQLYPDVDPDLFFLHLLGQIGLD